MAVFTSADPLTLNKDTSAPVAGCDPSSITLPLILIGVCACTELISSCTIIHTQKTTFFIFLFLLVYFSGSMIP